MSETATRRSNHQNTAVKESIAMARQQDIRNNRENKRAYADLVKYAKEKVAEVPKSNQQVKRKSSDQEASISKATKRGRSEVDSGEEDEFEQIRREVREISNELKEAQQARKETVSDADQDTQSLERELRETYDSFIPKNSAMRTPSRKEKAITISTPTREKATLGKLYLYLAKIPIKIVKSKHLQKYWKNTR